MPPRTITGSLKIGGAIKYRRNELNLTIEEAASKAGIGTKTWSRYESGESIRKDKVSGLCKALKWKTIPDMDAGVVDTNFFTEADFDEYKKSEAWSPYLMERFGKYAALSFVIGSDILLDEINEDLAALSGMPRGSHIGEIPSSFIASSMPEQFLMRYDYEFMWALRNTLIRLRKTARYSDNLIAHRVIDELVLYLILEESRFMMEEMEFDCKTGNIEVDDNDEYDYACDDEDENDYEDEDRFAGWDDWAFRIFDDMEVVTYLYSDLFILGPGDTYHFDNWFEQQFYVDEVEVEVEEAE